MRNIFKKRNYPFKRKTHNSALSWWFFFFIILNAFTCIHGLEAEGIGANEKVSPLPPQPTLVAGDIESLIPLAETSYLDGRPVLLFSGANQAANPLSLLDFSRSVVFHQEDPMELSLELFPATGTVTIQSKTHEKTGTGVKYRFAVGKKPLIVDVPQDGYYKVFARLRKGMQTASVAVDDEKLQPSSSDTATLHGAAGWLSFPRIYLARGSHVFTGNSGATELIIVPQDVFQEYFDYVKKALQQKQVSYLFANDEKPETTPDINSAGAKTRNFSIATPGKYQLRAYVSPICEDVNFRNIGLKLSGSELLAGADIVQDDYGNETAVLPLAKYNLDIEEYPNLRISYDLSEPSHNKLGFIIELDTDDDDVVDTRCYAGNIKYEVKPYQTIDMGNVTFKEKDFWYKVNRELGRAQGTDLHQWYFDAKGSGFSRNTEGDALVVSSDFSKSNHFVLTKHFQPIDLKKNQVINLEYKLDNPQTQVLKINFRVDTDGNGRPDKTIETDYSGNILLTKDGYVRQSINALTHSGVNPDDEKAICNLVEVILLCSGNGRYYLKNFSVGSQQIVVPQEIKRYLSDRAKMLNAKKREDEQSWTRNWRKQTFIPLNIVMLSGEEKREKGDTVLAINNILQQVQQALKNTYYCKVKGILPLLYREKKTGSAFLWKDNLKDVLKEILFFNYDTIEIPRFIAETKAEKEWEKKFEEETLQYGIEKAVYKRDWGNERYDVEEYALDEWFGVQDIKETMLAQFEINSWKIQGVNSPFNFLRFLDGIETSFYLDGGAEEDERVAFIPKTSDYQGLDLKEGISFDVSYELSDTSSTDIVLYAGIDFDGDKKEDATLRLFPTSVEDVAIPGKKIKVGHFDTSQALSLYPDKERLSLSSFLLAVEKKPGLDFLGVKGTIKKVFLHEVKIVKKMREENGTQFVVFHDKEGRSLLKTLPEVETLYKMDFSSQASRESSMYLRKGWEVSAQNTAYQISYNKEGMVVRGLFYRSGRERSLSLTKRLDNIDLQKYPYLRFQYEITGPEDANREKVGVELRGKCGNGKNFVLRLGGSRFKAEQRYCVHVMKELKKTYPDSNNFTIEDIILNIDPTIGRFNENLLSYSSDKWVGDRETQVNIRALQILGLKEKDVEGMLKRTAIREAGGNIAPGRNIDWKSEAMANTQFQYKAFGSEQYVRADFRKDGLREEGVILKAVLKQPLGVDQVQTVKFDYVLDSPEIQGVVIAPEFDSPYKPSAASFLNLDKKEGNISCNLAEKAKEVSREGEPPPRLTSLLFYLIKKPGINCEENNLTNKYTFSIKNIEFTTTTTTTTIYDKLLSESLVEFNGKKYYFEDGLKGGKTGNRLRNSEQAEVSASEDPTMAGFLSAGRMPFLLGEVEIFREDCRIGISPLSKYLKVDMVEIMKCSDSPRQSESQLTNGRVQEKDPEITFKKINPTRYVVDVKTEKPFWLVFSESFHAGWKAYMRQNTESRSQKLNEYKNTEHWSALISAWRDKGKRVELTEHQMVNGYANGWYVPVRQKPEVRNQRPEKEKENLSENFQIVLEYKPQRLFEIGVLISGMTFISCIGYLCWDGVRRIVYKGRK